MAFVRQLVSRRNVDRKKRFAEELAVLSPLPPQRRSTCTSVFLTVKSDSVIRVKRNAYSVSSKYIGLRLEVRIHQDHLELWYRGQCLERMPRQFGYDKEAIDFRHVIDSLVRKPGAFTNYKYVNHSIPRRDSAWPMINYFSARRRSLPSSSISSCCTLPSMKALSRSTTHCGGFWPKAR